MRAISKISLIEIDFLRMRGREVETNAESARGKSHRVSLSGFIYFPLSSSLLPLPPRSYIVTFWRGLGFAEWINSLFAEDAVGHDNNAL
jgi:hypothetical protein